MTELNCSLRSLQIALEADGVVVARRPKACPLAPPPSIGARSEFVASRQCNLRASVSRAADLQEEMAGQRFSVQTSAMREQKDQ